MTRKIITSILIALLLAAAIFSFSYLNLFNKMGRAFQTASPERAAGQHGQVARGRGARHGAMSVWTGFAQIAAYVAVFAGVAMLTYYAEHLLANRLKKREHCRQFEAADSCQMT